MRISERIQRLEAEVERQRLLIMDLRERLWKAEHPGVGAGDGHEHVYRCQDCGLLLNDGLDA